MYLDSENRLVLGVCSGIANWLDIPAAIVRIIFVICVFAWPPMLAAYVILYFCLDREFTPDKMRDFFRNPPGAAHFRQLNYRKPIYKNARKKRIAGVCAGIADYLEVSVFAVRIVTVLSLFVLGPFTFWAYLLCWFVFDPDPVDGERSRGWRRRRAERRRARAARKQARRSARKRGSGHRKSYRNEEFDPESNSASPEDGEYDPYDAEEDADSARSNPRRGDGSAYSARDREEMTARTTELFAELEMRLREIEAFMTSKKFRLHCEINRIRETEPG